MINFHTIEENKKIIGREGAIPYLVNFLRSNVEKLQRNSALTLRNLSANNGESMRLVVVLHIIAYICRYNIMTGIIMFNNVLVCFREKHASH